MNLKLKKIQLDWYLENTGDYVQEKRTVNLPGVFRTKSNNEKTYEKIIQIPVFIAKYDLNMVTKNSNIEWNYLSIETTGTIKKLESFHTKIMDICKSKSQALLYMRDEKLKELAKAKLDDFSDVEICLCQKNPEGYDDTDEYDEDGEDKSVDYFTSKLAMDDATKKYSKTQK